MLIAGEKRGPWLSRTLLLVVRQKYYVGPLPRCRLLRRMALNNLIKTQACCNKNGFCYEWVNMRNKDGTENPTETKLVDKTRSMQFVKTWVLKQNVWYGLSQVLMLMEKNCQFFSLSNARARNFQRLAQNYKTAFGTGSEISEETHPKVLMPSPPFTTFLQILQYISYSGCFGLSMI